MQKTKFKQTEIGMIPEDWEEKELQKISRVIDSCHKTPKYSPEGIAMVRVTDIKYGDIDLKNTLKVTTDVYDEFTLNHKPQKNDIVMSRVGTYGVTSFVSTNDLFCLGQNTVVIHPSINSRFIYYALNSKLVKTQIEEEVTGSTQKTISLKDIRELLIACPTNTEELKLIAKILSSLDSKIELNQQMNKTLEAIGQALFKHWFIDFEFPNEKGKPYKSSGGEMVDSEMGEIPKGWKVGKLGDYIDFIKGKKPFETSEEFIEGYLPQILIENLDGGQPVYTNTEKMVVVEETEPIMVMDGASSGRIEIGHRGVLGSTLSKVIVKNDLLTNSYVLHFLKIHQEDINQNTTGTSIPHTDKERIKRYTLALPDKRLLELFDKLAVRILYKIISTKREIKNLSEIRDSLLPKLMSGKIRVPVEVK